MTSITYKVLADEYAFKVRVDSGHVYVVLKDGVPDDDVAFLAEYWNSDQNQNQGTSKNQVLQSTHKAIEAELKVTPHPQVSKVTQRGYRPVFGKSCWHAGHR